MIEKLDARIGFHNRHYDRPGVVSTPVVNDDELPVAVGLCQHRRDGMVYKVRTIVCAEDDRSERHILGL